MSNLVDGKFPVDPARSPDRIAAEEKREKLLDALLDVRLKDRWRRATEELAKVEIARREVPPPDSVYAGTVHRGSGAFLGTGASGGKPRPIHVLARGDVRKPGKEVAPAGFRCVAEVPSDFGLRKGHAEGERRLALAKWIVAPENPLTWRSIVNRIWRHHFGRGIVETPNDFGRGGQTPTHPELLDWLATEFRDSGQSFKRLHRLLVTSSAYRQSSEIRPDAAKQDADNALVWRSQRRKLEAEAVRDAMLAVSGRLDRKLGGPSFQDFVIEKPEHSPHYQYHLHDPDDPRSHRRSLYRFLVRSQQQPFMTALDCADPSMQVDRRNETLSALQALALLNDGFVLTMARHFAARVEREAKRDPADRIRVAVRLALGRDPTRHESRALGEHAARHGLPSTCRLLFNLNEFTFVD
jgi:hypothetical protein